MNVILDHAGSITFVTDAPSVSEAEVEAFHNVRIADVNVAYRTDYSTADEYAENVAYPVTEIPFAQLHSYERGGCQYDECHNLSFGPDYRSEKYCDDHAGPVNDEYEDVTVIWEGSLAEMEYCITDHDKVLDIVKETEEAVAEARKEGRLNEEYGVQVSTSFHSHEFDSREQSEEFYEQGSECFCESYDVLYDSRDDLPGENGLPE